ncbi:MULTISPECIES: 23S rRNA (adenine(1618)-N(6))-methyltransferase RlmF [unclassified Lentimonas]|uniref:23S rRNA (adenine(1618)-N(6))-methyltransferase RlmF n=2 Tax=unclassified Lentimonas TaxID=2630993 RepID=UPI001389D577|nr:MULTISPECIES: 23S rRNA (adenine(1618)-N(6))-methyltransferase RlmF [unclassified Lentimonas]
MTMPSPKKNSQPSGTLHPRNPHQGRYNFSVLCEAVPELKQYVRQNPLGEPTIDFSDSAAVLCLNQALLAHVYQVRHWMIPAGYLCPPIPGRADMIHYLADLLAGDGQVPTGKQVRVLDIGTGANCIYPIIGSQSYGWKFVATDIDPVSVKTARLIVESNPCLSKLVKVVQQKERGSIFKGIIRQGDQYELTLCNPPFHASLAAAQAGSQRKVNNLSKGQAGKGAAKLNFGGQQAELWCQGGEVAFITQMIRESAEFAAQVGWFSSLVSKGEHVRLLKKVLAQSGAQQVEVIPMSQGQKISRLLAWRF